MVPETKTIGEIFDGAYQYAIPEFQRDYSWGEVQQTDFLKDLLQHMGEQYFFGTIILVESEKGGNNQIYSLIDGQQRMTTFTIFFQAIKDLIVETRKSLENASEETDYDHLLVKSETDPVSGKKKENSVLINPKLYPILPVKILGIGDFKDMVDAQTLEQEAILESYTQLKKILSFKSINQTIQIADRNPSVQKYLTESESLESYILFLTDLAKQLKDNSSMVVINSDNKAFAQTIFKNLNSRGIPLNSIDLIKNDMLDILEYTAQSGFVEETWAEILENSSKLTKNDVGNNRNPEDFFGRFWTMRANIGLKSAYGRKMYEYFEKSIDQSKKEYRKLLDDLRYASRFYKLFFTVNAETPMFDSANYFKTDANSEVLLDLNFLRFYDQERTFIMALLIARDKNLITNKKFKKVIRSAVYIRLIWQVAGGKPNRFAFFDATARLIHNAVQKNDKGLVNDAIDAFKTKVLERTNGQDQKDISKEDFIAAFNKLTYGHKKTNNAVIVKYLLVILEMSLMPQKPMNNELSQLFGLQVEHVIPFSKGVTHMGDLSLISADEEHEIDRLSTNEESEPKVAADFASKREIYARSKVRSLVELSKLDQFNQNDVSERGAKMGDAIFEFIMDTFQML